MAAGTRLGPDEILARVGAGGMGEVYKARDSRLDRIVAIKVAKEKFNARFQGEARAVAALNHPHICQLYDVGPDYLVFEFVEGGPLQTHLAPKKAVEYAGQILGALDAAHRKGFIHILVTRNGIKLLDFGLAKLASSVKESDATMTASAGCGQIPGTLQYMSPEQLHGKDTDSRSDLFSFGCVFYELLTGKRAFDGESPASVIAAILEREPAKLESTAPFEWVIHRCRAKNPEDRWQNAKDLKAAIPSDPLGGERPGQGFSFQTDRAGGVGPGGGQRWH
jgi:serine/threonine protein kinase